MPPKQNQEPLKQNPEASKDRSINEPSGSAQTLNVTRMITKWVPKLPRNFSFQVEATSKLKDAVEALRKLDSTTDTTATGVIEVDPKGVEIVTAVNTEIKVLACLILRGVNLITFKYWKPVSKKMVDLNRIADHLRAADNHMIGIHLIDGSNELSFTLGRPPRSFNLELHDTNADVKMIPEFTGGCEAVVPSEDLRQIIQHIEKTKSEIASFDFDMRDGTLSIKIAGKEWTYYYLYMDKNLTRLEMLLPQPSHFESLRKASFLTESIDWCLAIDPFECIMLQFNIQELGCVLYIIGKDEVLPKLELGKPSSSDINPAMDESVKEQSSSPVTDEQNVEPGEQRSSSGTDEQNVEPGDAQVKYCLRDIKKCPPCLQLGEKREKDLVPRFKELRKTLQNCNEQNVEPEEQSSRPVIDDQNPDALTIMFRSFRNDVWRLDLPSGAPLLHFVRGLDPASRVEKIKDGIGFLHNHDNFPHGFTMLFALCAVIDTPLDADTTSALRHLLADCAELLAAKSKWDEEVTMLNILLTITRKVFGILD